MDTRKNHAVRQLTKELKQLRQGCGARDTSFHKMEMLTLLLGDDHSMFIANLYKAIARHVTDDNVGEPLVVALNIDNGWSDDDLSTRRSEATTMFEANIRTISRREDVAIKLLAEGLANEFPEKIDDFLKDSGVTLPSSSEVVDQLINGIADMQTRLSEMERLLDQLT